MSIFKKLKFDGIEIGNVQSVNEMSIVPILGSDRGVIAKPQCLQFRATTSYGTMVFENTDPDKEAIIPTNMMVRGKGAQDHAMAGSGIVMRKSQRTFNNACCIESSQGGYLTAQGNETDILPIELRKDFINKSFRERHDYGKLWPKISTWLQGLRLSHSGASHLRYFYDTPDVKTALEDFAAEFEPVDNQIGAIVMFSGIPVGIEIMPSAEHWDAYWKLLIRGCYGAEMIRLKMLNKIKPSTLILPDIPKDSTPEQVQDIMMQFTQHLRSEILPLLENIELKRQNIISRDGELQTSLLETPSGGGDLITQGNVPIYLSLVL